MPEVWGNSCQPSEELCVGEGGRVGHGMAGVVLIRSAGVEVLPERSAFMEQGKEDLPSAPSQQMARKISNLRFEFIDRCLQHRGEMR